MLLIYRTQNRISLEEKIKEIFRWKVCSFITKRSACKLLLGSFDELLSAIHFLSVDNRNNNYCQILCVISFWEDHILLFSLNEPQRCVHDSVWDYLHHWKKSLNVITTERQCSNWCYGHGMDSSGSCRLDNRFHHKYDKTMMLSCISLLSLAFEYLWVYLSFWGIFFSKRTILSLGFVFFFIIPIG